MAGETSSSETFGTGPGEALRAGRLARWRQAPFIVDHTAGSVPLTRNGAKDKVPPVGARTRQARRTTVELWRLQGRHAIRAEIGLTNYFVRLITP